MKRRRCRQEYTCYYYRYYLLPKYTLYTLQGVYVKCSEGALCCTRVQQYYIYIYKYITRCVCSVYYNIRVRIYLYMYVDLIHG